MNGQPDMGWNDLLGQQVQIHKHGRFIRSGYVEDVTYAGDALWLQGHGADPRMLYLKADGFVPEVLSGPQEDYG
jgi:hypothetical protein